MAVTKVETGTLIPEQKPFDPSASVPRRPGRPRVQDDDHGALPAFRTATGLGPSVQTRQRHEEIHRPHGGRSDVFGPTCPAFLLGILFCTREQEEMGARRDGEKGDGEWLRDDFRRRKGKGRDACCRCRTT